MYSSGEKKTYTANGLKGDIVYVIPPLLAFKTLYYLLFIIYYLLFIIYYLLFIIYYFLLFIIYYLLFIIYYLLFIIYYLLFIIYYLLFIIYYLLIIIYYYSIALWHYYYCHHYKLVSPMASTHSPWPSTYSSSSIPPTISWILMKEIQLN